MPQALSAGIWGILLLVPLFSRAEFYSFEENSQPSWKSPVEIISDAARVSNDLFKWTVHDGDRPEPIEKYNRLKDFGTWVDDSRTSECYDTRSLVLIRDSSAQVKFSAENPCKVYSGQWTDPYGGANYNMARDIQIDHVVALKNAYMSGAFAWDYQHRCLYANFLGYDKHLISASSVENQTKSDKGPEGWMPSDSSYACQHLQNWLVIKFIWNLNMLAEEVRAIENEAQKNHCDASTFQFSKAEISRIRRFAQQNLDLCSQH